MPVGRAIAIPEVTSKLGGTKRPSDSVEQFDIHAERPPIPLAPDTEPPERPAP